MDAILWICISVGILVYLLGPVVMRWLTSQIASQVASKVLRQVGDKSAPTANLVPESSYQIQINTHEIICNRPDGSREKVTWEDIQKVEILTTNDGPFLPDVFWVLHGTHSGCVIPQGATGGGELLKKLQSLPGFDSGVFLEAMGSTSNAVFVCWVKPS